MKKHGIDGKRRVWLKLHLAVDADTHEIIAAELTLSGVTDAEVLLLRAHAKFYGLLD